MRTLRDPATSKSLISWLVILYMRMVSNVSFASTSHTWLMMAIFETFMGDCVAVLVDHIRELKQRCLDSSED